MLRAPSAFDAASLLQFLMAGINGDKRVLPEDVKRAIKFTSTSRLDENMVEDLYDIRMDLAEFAGNIKATKGISLGVSAMINLVQFIAEQEVAFPEVGAHLNQYCQTTHGFALTNEQQLMLTQIYQVMKLRADVDYVSCLDAGFRAQAAPNLARTKAAMEQALERLGIEDESEQFEQFVNECAGAMRLIRNSLKEYSEDQIQAVLEIMLSAPNADATMLKDHIEKKAKASGIGVVLNPMQTLAFLELFSTIRPLLLKNFFEAVMAHDFSAEATTDLLKSKEIIGLGQRFGLTISKSMAADFITFKQAFLAAQDDLANLSPEAIRKITSDYVELLKGDPAAGANLAIAAKTLATTGSFFFAPGMLSFSLAVQPQKKVLDAIGNPKINLALVIGGMLSKLIFDYKLPTSVLIDSLNEMIYNFMEENPYLAFALIVAPVTLYLVSNNIQDKVKSAREEFVLEESDVALPLLLSHGGPSASTESLCFLAKRDGSFERHVSEMQSRPSSDDAKKPGNLG